MKLSLADPKNRNIFSPGRPQGQTPPPPTHTYLGLATPLFQGSGFSQCFFFNCKFLCPYIAHYYNHPIFTTELEDSKRHVKNETIPEEVKSRKSLPPSFLYILSLIVQQNPFSLHHTIPYKPEHPSYYVINRCDDYRSN